MMSLALLWLLYFFPVIFFPYLLMLEGTLSSVPRNHSCQFFGVMQCQKGLNLGLLQAKYIPQLIKLFLQYFIEFFFFFFYWWGGARDRYIWLCSEVIFGSVLRMMVVFGESYGILDAEHKVSHVKSNNSTCCIIPPGPFLEILKPFIILPVLLFVISK